MPGPVFAVRAVLLDGAETLLLLAEPADRVYCRVGARHGLRVRAEEVAPRLKAALRRFRRPPPSGVPLSRIPRIEREAWRAVVRASLGDRAAGGPVFEELWSYYGTPAAWRVAEGAPEALDRVRALGIRTAIVSNMDARLPGLLESFGLVPRIDFVAIPSTVGLAKPDPRIFLSALGRLNVHPFEALYVGDREPDCLAAARGAGVPSIRYDPAGDPSSAEVLARWNDLPGRLGERTE